MSLPWRVRDGLHHVAQRPRSRKSVATRVAHVLQYPRGIRRGIDRRRPPPTARPASWRQGNRAPETGRARAARDGAAGSSCLRMPTRSGSKTDKVPRHVKKSDCEGMTSRFAHRRVARSPASVPPPLCCFDVGPHTRPRAVPTSGPNRRRRERNPGACERAGANHPLPARHSPIFPGLKMPSGSMSVFTSRIKRRSPGSMRSSSFRHAQIGVLYIT